MPNGEGVSREDRYARPVEELLRDYREQADRVRDLEEQLRELKAENNALKIALRTLQAGS